MADPAADAPGPTGLSLEPHVRTERGLGLPHRPVTVVFLHGEHDFESRGLVRAALERAGRTLEIILPPSHAHLTRTFDRLGARALLPIRDAPPAAEA